MDLTSYLIATRNRIAEAWTAVIHCNKCSSNNNEEESSNLDTDIIPEEIVPLNGRQHKQENNSGSATTAISQQLSTHQLIPTQKTIGAINANDPVVNPTNTNNLTTNPLITSSPTNASSQPNTNNPTTNPLITCSPTNANSQPNTNNPTNTFNPTNTNNPTFTNKPTFVNEPVTNFIPETNVDIYLGLEEILKTSFNASNDNHGETSSRSVTTKMKSIIEWETATVDTASELIDRAVIGGYDVDGTDLWIIRSRLKGEVIPGKLNYNHRKSIDFYQTDDKDAEKTIDEFEVCCVAPENIERIKWIKCSGGDVPKNAVEGGRRASGQKLYIGRCTHRDMRYEDVKTLCPGMIQPNHRVLYITYEQSVYAAKGYEVMCID